MNKRQLLQALSLWLLTSKLGLLNPVLAAAPPNQRKRLLVIGAGLAGLACARELAQQGHEVFVLEGRERIGGRIWTSEQWPDLPVDMGATWIHGVIGNPITALADEINAVRLTTRYERSIAYSADGQRLTESQQQQLQQLQQQVTELLAKAQHSDAEDCAIEQTLSAMFDRLRADPATTQLLNFVISSTYEQEYAGSAQQLSTQWFDSAKTFAGDDQFFAKGFQQIPQYLARDLHIEFRQIVQSIHWGNTGVQVRCQQQNWQADQVVITVPLGVLKQQRILFVPELPVAKQQAIQQLGMGVLNKCYLKFSKVFWPAEVDWLEYAAAKHGHWSEWVSLFPTTKVPVLLGFNAAERGHAIEQLSDEAIVADAMETLRRIFGPNIPQPNAYQITRWAKDPFSGGSYSFNAVDAGPKTRAILAEPLQQRLFFAGEATEPYFFGTAHGAYLSGLRAAAAVLETR